MYYVFFDVDGTLIKGNSLWSFAKFFCGKQQRFAWKVKYYCYLFGIKLLALLKVNRVVLNQLYYKQFSGLKQVDLISAGYEWFLEQIKADFYIQSVLHELLTHKAKGGEIVLVSGSFEACLNPIAEHLEIEHVICTNLEIKNELYTGKVLLPVVIGTGKMHSIKSFLANKEDVFISECYAYGDHISDLDMLQIVGHPHVVRGDRRLEQLAFKNGWLMLGL